MRKHTEQSTGRLDLEYYDVLSKEVYEVKISVENNSRYGILQADYAEEPGYFRNYPVDTQILSGSGRLIFTAP